MNEEKNITIPQWIAKIFLIFVAILIVACWWLSLSVHGGKCYRLGEMIERNRNPTKQYIEDGTPFIWYKGTYYRVQYIGKKTFRAVE